ncbi:MAG: MarR family transcriptional regulator, partial [Caldiserica bacterium]
MNETIEEREYRVLEIVSNDIATSQRKIANKLGLSLGLTNLIIKNLMKKGYIKIVGLNRKKVKYI